MISDNILVAHEVLHSLGTRDKVSSDFMAIKTDMMKAYDRLEWSFMEKTLRLMGFDERWVKLVIICITYISYGVLINGRPHGIVTPSRGLKQGDPLSPFIFILCAEVLGHAFSLAEEEGILEGIKVDVGSPAVSHLLFANDSLFFCRAERTQVEEIKRILDDYSK